MRLRRLLVPFVCVLFASCEEETQGPPATEVLFSQGQRWTYEVSQVFRDSSGSVTNTVRDSFEVRVAATADTVLGMQGLVRLEARSILSSGLTPPDTQRVWYRVTSSSVVEVAYQNAGSNLALLKGASYGRGLVYGGIFNPLLVVGSRSSDGPPLRREEDRVVLVYPLTAGAQWVSFTVPFHQWRVVEDRETLSFPFGEFQTMRVRTSSDFGGQPMVFYDWVANEGLVRRWMQFETVFAGQDGPEGTSGTVETEAILTSLIR